MQITNSQSKIYRMSQTEREWVEGFRERSAEALACIRYALTCARRETSWLLGECRPDVEYASQLVDNLHSGIDEVSHIFGDRMSDPAWYPSSGELPLIELATMPDGRPCGVLVQRTSRFDSGPGRPGFWMTFSCDADGKVIRMQSGCLPSSITLDRSGIFPGIPAARLKQEKARKPAILPAGIPLRMLYVYSKDDPDWLTSAQTARDALQYFNMGSMEVIPLDRDPSREADAVWLFKKAALALPHLHIVSQGEDVLRLDGPFDQDRLMPELYQRFCAPGGSDVEPGRVKGLLEDSTPGMGTADRIQWLYYCDPGRIDEIMDAFQGYDQLAARRAAYVLDRLSCIKKDVIQPYAAVLLAVSHDDPNTGRLRHIARMLPRLTLSKDERYRAEQLLLNLSWQQSDVALQVFALRSLRIFARTNFRLREYAGQFVYDLMCRVRNGTVMREAERTLDTIEYFEEQVHEQWDRLQAHA